MSRSLPIALVAALLAWATPAPADDPEVPEKYISVDEVKALLDGTDPPTLVDVRARSQYETMHIRGALSIPLPDIQRRLAEVPTKGLVVLY
jgi:rhodanese-related sulfurtransferase